MTLISLKLRINNLSHRFLVLIKMLLQSPEFRVLLPTVVKQHQFPIRIISIIFNDYDYVIDCVTNNLTRSEYLLIFDNLTWLLSTTLFLHDEIFSLTIRTNSISVKYLANWIRSLKFLLKNLKYPKCLKRIAVFIDLFFKFCE